MAAKKNDVKTPHPRITVGGNFAASIGSKRKGALVRSILIDPDSYSVPNVLGHVSHPLVDMGIGSGGSGGEVRLKLWLSLMCQFNSTNDWTHLDRYQPGMLARIFGLDEDLVRGKESVRRAYRWLAANNFIVIEGGRLKRSGRVRVTTEAALYLPEQYVVQFRQTPSGSSLLPPYPEFPRYKDSYFRVPIELWSKGWMGYLRSSEIIVLMLLCKLNENQGGKPIEIRANRRLERYGLSDVMWRQGAKGLERRNILESWEPALHDLDQVTGEPTNYRMVFRLNGDTVEDALTQEIDHDHQMKIRTSLR